MSGGVPKGRLSVYLSTTNSARDAADQVDPPPETRSALEVNAPEGTPFQSAGFKGHVLFLNRPDPEHPTWLYNDHFRDKMRRFEFRLQGVFLTEPGDDIYFGVEVAKAINLGPALRITANWVLSVISILCAARGTSYSYNLEFQEEPGGTVRPYLAFPVCAADAIVVTPAGEKPPRLTQSFDPMSPQDKRRVRFNMTDTFTFVYWSKQADFERWEICNMPFGWSSSFASFIGKQEVHLTAYRLLESDGQGNELHSEARKDRLLGLVLANPLGGGKREETKPAGRATWSLEAAELSVEDYERVWLKEHERPAQQGAPAPTSWPWNILADGMCACTNQRHGLR